MAHGVFVLITGPSMPSPCVIAFPFQRWMNCLTSSIAAQYFQSLISMLALRGFLGITGYYQRFVRHYASIAAPLTNMLKQPSFTWSAVVNATFMALRDVLLIVRTLRLPDFSLRFEVASTYEREMLAITEAVRKWWHYLLSRKFFIYTDPQSLHSLLTQTMQTPTQHKWLSKLLGFDYEILYTPWKGNVVADALSRHAATSFSLLFTVSIVTLTVLADLRAFYLSHPAGQSVLQHIRHTLSSKLNFPNFSAGSCFRSFIALLSAAIRAPTLSLPAWLHPFIGLK
ncbi:UNVERIFIED_CONTAM: Retrovirus-related Pol polyprotein from transposon [Sesamum calycinum]|uniref:Retrovirus-related Pol polyprotein from transposon n=1 Tax=Sesamum calycinum TaxID=2727403 RepID=A0AAW2N292_9LAMI